jgi:hypothetical protein
LEIFRTVLPADARLCLARDLLIVVVPVMQLNGGVAIFFPRMGRVPLIREVVHPEMPWMRAVFCWVGGWLSGTGIVSFLYGADRPA